MPACLMLLPPRIGIFRSLLLGFLCSLGVFIFSSCPLVSGLQSFMNLLQVLESALIAQREVSVLVDRFGWSPAQFLVSLFSSFSLSISAYAECLKKKLVSLVYVWSLLCGWCFVLVFSPFVKP